MDTSKFMQRFLASLIIQTSVHMRFKTIVWDILPAHWTSRHLYGHQLCPRRRRRVLCGIATSAFSWA